MTAGGQATQQCQRHPRQRSRDMNDIRRHDEQIETKLTEIANQERALSQTTAAEPPMEHYTRVQKLIASGKNLTEEHDSEGYVFIRWNPVARRWT